MSTPESLILPESAPMAIKAYRRRFISPATNVTNVVPGSVANIYPDTSTPGAFMDPSSTYLSFDLEITNNNFMIDYQNFGVEGAVGAVIQQLRVYNQGTVLEDIAEYGTVASTIASLEGDNQEEYHMYFSNKLKHGYVGDMHRNFIKPPMCDESGNIMHALNPFGIGYESNVDNSSYISSTSGTAANNRAIVGTIFASKSMGSGAGIISVADVNGGGAFNCEAYEYAGPTWANRGVSTAPVAPLNVTPMHWPDYYSSSQSEIVKSRFISEFGSINKPQIMANLVNVKCFPIGMRPAQNCMNTGAYGQALSAGVINGSTAVIGANTSSATAPTAKTSTVRICGQFLSGIMGKLAPKMLATTLLAPQQLYLQLDTAQVPIALKISSDPCRRIPGTIRDYVRNVGTRNGAPYGSNVWARPAAVSQLQFNANEFLQSSYAPGYGPFYRVNMSNGDSSFGLTTAGTIFNEAAAAGRLTRSEALVNTTTSVNATVTVGTGIMTINGGDETIADTQNWGPGTLVVAYSGIYAMILNKLTSTTYTTTLTVAVGATEWYKVNSEYMGRLPLPPAPQYALCTTPWQYKTYNNASTSNNTINYCPETSVFYGTRLPQSVPQVKRVLYFSSIEGAAFSNTTLTSGMPQFSNTALSYRLLNMALCGDQIILPDDVTASIIGQAETGQFNVRTNSIRSYVINPPSSAEQNIILPVKVAQAKQLYVVWQNMEQRNNGSALYYDSNCGYNPYASITPAPNSQNMFQNGFALGGKDTTVELFGVGFKDPLVYTPTSTNANALKQQLKIGNELFPPTPLSTMAELSAELVKTLNGWGDKFFSPCVHGRIAQNLGSGGSIGLIGGVPAATDQPTYDCLAPNKFTTAFIDANLLDDQTITGNADFVPLYSQYGDETVESENAAPTASTSYVNGYNWMCPRGYCLHGMFEVPSGRFVTGFNLTTFKPSEGVDGGMYLGNNTITLAMSGAVGLANGTWRGVVIIPHRALMRYQAGGQIVWNY